MPLDYTIRLAQATDVSTAARIITTAFRNNEIFRAFAPQANEKPEELHRWVALLMRSRLAKPWMRLTVAEEIGTGRLLGYGCWEAIGSNNRVRETWIKESSRWWQPLEQYLRSWEIAYAPYFLYPSIDYQIIRDFIAESSACGTTGELQIPENQLHLHTLAVLPELQGHGVGKALINWGLHQADVARLPATIESSVVAVPVYEKCGFKRIGGIPVAKGRPDREFVIPILLREPLALAQDRGIGADVTAEGRI